MCTGCWIKDGYIWAQSIAASFGLKTAISTDQARLCHGLDEKDGR
jgi:hypothetical protein